jgi:hypothetical protein
LKLARGAKDEEHVMSQQINARVAVVGIDIGKNRSTLLVRTAARDCSAAKVVAQPG